MSSRDLIDREMAQSYAKRGAWRRRRSATNWGCCRWRCDGRSRRNHPQGADDLAARAARAEGAPPDPRRVRTVVRPGQGPHARLYVELGLATMARPTAILELTWDRVDFERGTVDLNPSGRRQTRKRRPVVPLNDDALEALREAYSGRQSQFVIERGAQQVKSIKKAFQAASAVGDPRHALHAAAYRRGVGGRGRREHGRARAVSSATMTPPRHRSITLASARAI
jgi:integrase